MKKLLPSACQPSGWQVFYLPSENISKVIKSLYQKAKWTVEGLLSSPLKNLQVISQSLGKSDHQAWQQFFPIPFGT